MEHIEQVHRDEIIRLIDENSALKALSWRLCQEVETPERRIEIRSNQNTIRRNTDQIDTLETEIAHLEVYGVPHPGW